MTKSRRRYLIELSDEYDVPRDVVFMLADMLGPNEDYDGLVYALEDYVDISNGYTPWEFVGIEGGCMVWQ